MKIMHLIHLIQEIKKEYKMKINDDKLRIEINNDEIIFILIIGISNYKYIKKYKYEEIKEELKLEYKDIKEIYEYLIKSEYEIKKDSIKPIAHRFEKEEELSPIAQRNENFEEKTSKLIDIINEEKEKKDKSIEMEEQYFMKEKEKDKIINVGIEKEEVITSNYIKNYRQEYKEKVDQIQNIPKEQEEIQIRIDKEFEIEKSPIREKEEKGKEENRRRFSNRFKVKGKAEKEKLYFHVL